MDDRGALRDWNEDYQGAREMPATTVGERVVRAKILFKVLSDFGEAAVEGAKAVVGGFVTPINPNEARRNHVYVFNNIFFSYALDTQNTFKVVGGDGPAFKNALHEVRNIVMLNKILADATDNAAVTAAAAAAAAAAEGAEGAAAAEGDAAPAAVTATAAVAAAAKKQQQLYTLATSVIDYLGVRLVAQSVIPGILSGDQQSRLLYGSVEPGVKLQAKEEMHSLLKEASGLLFLAEREVPALPVRVGGKTKEGGKKEGEKKEEGEWEKVEGKGEEKEGGKEGGKVGETIKFVGPVEWKGIKGADARCYLLDLVRLTPRDPNWIKEDWKHPQGSGTGVWERARPMEGVPALEEDFSVVLRPELLRLFVRSKVMGLRELIGNEFRSKVKKEGGKKEGGKEGGGMEGEEEEEVELDEETKARLKEEEEELLERMKINPNAFLPLEGISDLDQLAKDEEQIRVLGRFLWHDLLPAFVEDVKTGGLNPIDGETLTANMHQSGINTRYIGRLAQLAQEEGGKEGGGVEGKRFRLPEYFVHLCETEMIARGVKHLVFDLLKDRPDLRLAPAATLVACLNAVLGKVEAKEPVEGDREGGEGAAAAAGGKKKKIKKPATDTPAESSSSSPALSKNAAVAAAATAAAAAAAAGGGGGKKGKGKKNKANNGMNGTSSSLPSSSSSTTSLSPAAATAAAAAATAAATAAAFFSAPTTEAPPSTPTIELSLEELRGRVIADIKKRYRYSSPTLLKAGVGTPSKNPHALLRRVCQKLGLRLYARAFDFSSNKREPLSVRDIAEVTPVAKHCLPSSILDEAKDLVHSAKILAQTGNVGPAFQYVSEATDLFTQTLGPVHVEVAHCLELSGTILCQAGDDTGIGQIEKALAIYWQTSGFDSFEAINAHHILGLFFQQVQKGAKYDQAIFHFHACIYLLELVAGPYSPELPPQYLKLATAYQELGHAKEAYQCLVLAFDKSQHLPDRVTEAQMAHQLALLESSHTLFKEALTHEKRAYVIFRDILGEDHPRVAEASRFMTELTQKAVERATTKQTRALAANAALAAAVAAGGGKEGGKKKSSGGSGVSTGAPAVAPDDSWVTDLEAAEQARMGGGGKKKKGGKKR